MVTNAEILTGQGFVNVADLIAAASFVGLPLWIAAAFASKESHGRNIYGHDRGGVFTTTDGSNITVTEENYKEFYHRVVDLKETSNGVGPMQITYRGYFPQAATQGLKLWVPYDNFVFGFRIIKSKFTSGEYTLEEIQKAGTLYNAGNLNNGITAYGYDVATRAMKFKELLAAPVVTPPPVVTQPAPVTPAPAKKGVLVLLLVQKKGDKAIWVTNFVTRRHVPNSAALVVLKEEMKALGFSTTVKTVASLDAYGAPVVG